MLKVVVFDCGYGGEFFADKLAEELPVVEIIRVIDWRHAPEIQSNPRKARGYTEKALRPYIGAVDLIIFANHLLTITSLKYFRRKYKSQKFLGFKLKTPDSSSRRDTFILTTKAVTHTINYQSYRLHLKRRHKTLALDAWPAKIDDGELDPVEVKSTLKTAALKSGFTPGEIVLGCAHFSDIKSDIKNTFGCTTRIYDSYSDVIRQTYKLLNIHGGASRRYSRKSYK